MCLSSQLSKVTYDLLVTNVYTIKSAYCHHCIGSAWEIINGIINVHGKVLAKV